MSTWQGPTSHTVRLLVGNGLAEVVRRGQGSGSPSDAPIPHGCHYRIASLPPKHNDTTNSMRLTLRLLITSPLIVHAFACRVSIAIWSATTVLGPPRLKGCYNCAAALVNADLDLLAIPSIILPQAHPPTPTASSEHFSAPHSLRLSRLTYHADVLSRDLPPYTGLLCVQ